MASLICWFFSNSMFTYLLDLLDDHAVPAMVAQPRGGDSSAALARRRLRRLLDHSHGVLSGKGTLDRAVEIVADDICTRRALAQGPAKAEGNKAAE